MSEDIHQKLNRGVLLYLSVQASKTTVKTFQKKLKSQRKFKRRKHHDSKAKIYKMMTKLFSWVEEILVTMILGKKLVPKKEFTLSKSNQDYSILREITMQFLSNKYSFY